jgi:hypothetical protein
MAQFKTYRQMMEASEHDGVIDKLVVLILSTKRGCRMVLEGHESLQIVVDLPPTLNTKYIRDKCPLLCEELRCRFKDHEFGKTYPLIKNVSFHPMYDYKLIIDFEGTPLLAADAGAVENAPITDHHNWSEADKAKAAAWYGVSEITLGAFLDSGHRFLHIRKGGPYTFSESQDAFAVNVERHQILKYYVEVYGPAGPA